MGIIQHLRAIAVETQKSYFFELARWLERVEGTALEKKRFTYAASLIQQRHERFVGHVNDTRRADIDAIQKREQRASKEEVDNAEDILHTL